MQQSFAAYVSPVQLSASLSTLDTSSQLKTIDNMLAALLQSFETLLQSPPDHLMIALRDNSSLRESICQFLRVHQLVTGELLFLIPSSSKPCVSLSDSEDVPLVSTLHELDHRISASIGELLKRTERWPLWAWNAVTLLRVTSLFGTTSNSWLAQFIHRQIPWLASLPAISLNPIVESWRSVCQLHAELLAECCQVSVQWLYKHMHQRITSTNSSNTAAPVPPLLRSESFKMLKIIFVSLWQFFCACSNLPILAVFASVNSTIEPLTQLTAQLLTSCSAPKLTASKSASPFSALESFSSKSLSLLGLLCTLRCITLPLLRLWSTSADLLYRRCCQLCHALSGQLLCNLTGVDATVMPSTVFDSLQINGFATRLDEQRSAFVQLPKFDAESAADAVYRFFDDCTQFGETLALVSNMRPSDQIFLDLTGSVKSSAWLRSLTLAPILSSLESHIDPPRMASLRAKLQRFSQSHTQSSSSSSSLLPPIEYSPALEMQRAISRSSSTGEKKSVEKSMSEEKKSMVICAPSLDGVDFSSPNDNALDDADELQRYMQRTGRKLRIAPHNKSPQMLQMSDEERQVRLLPLSFEISRVKISLSACQEPCPVLCGI